MNIDSATPRTRTARLLMALPVAALAFSLAACSGPTRPSVDEVAGGISQIYEEQGLGDQFTDDMATCFAEALVESDLSNETLSYIADGEDKQKNVEERDLTEKILTDKQAECIGQ